MKKTSKLKIKLDKRYIEKSLDKETFIKCMATDNGRVLHRLYQIANEVKEEQYFMEIEDDVYSVSAKIISKFGYAGDALRQAETLSFMKDIVKQKPSWTIKFRVYTKKDMVDVFEFRHETTSVEDVVNTINKLETKTKEICRSKVNTY